MFEEVLHKIEKFIESNHWCGWDPYDGLNSKFLKFLTFDHKLPRITATQFMKRFPVNLRRILGVPKSRNPKAMGIIARAYLMRYQETKEQKYLDKTKEILDWLVTCSCTGYSGYAWGHNFDWQSSVFYLPKGVPTVVNTSFIVHAFLDAYEALKEKIYLDVARSTCDFVLKDLNRTYLSEIKKLPSAIGDQSSVYCFSYSPIDKTCVHNANLLATELLARVYSFTKETELFEQCNRSVRFTMQHQNNDGSWFYALGQRQRYIDSFHTGFELSSIKNILNYLDYVDRDGFKQKLRKGYKYYKKTFFDADGLPNFYYNRIFPIDLHCTSQGIITFLKFKEYDTGAVDMANKIASWAIENMWDDKKGYFYFQKTNYFTNKIPYLRWPNVWMFYALTLLRAEQCQNT
ncbi:hypothetical protein AMJ52_05730 [candidate division TA06 bacterium DG_78]|uniref:Delta-aminolevulinic acid dehydratase n=1 Tax=candidate division TA06 bacterium DG_78 TaxID=1703772 RepID=A0A0S7YD53_UNCT6|nr:MAG: hypothetical protein AMJ52_05730 [candidate division TA06 bacterium DG_78]